MYENNVEMLQSELTELSAELAAYQEKGFTNKSQAARIRKKTMAVGKLLKEFRAESVEHHR